LLALSGAPGGTLRNAWWHSQQFLKHAMTRLVALSGASGGILRTAWWHSEERLVALSGEAGVKVLQDAFSSACPLSRASNFGCIFDAYLSIKAHEWHSHPCRFRREKIVTHALRQTLCVSPTVA